MRVFEFVTVIVALGLVFRLLQLWIKKPRQAENTPTQSADLLEQIERLEDRVRVLERIVTDRPDELKLRFDDLENGV